MKITPKNVGVVKPLATPSNFVLFSPQEASIKSQQYTKDFFETSKHNKKKNREKDTPKSVIYLAAISALSLLAFKFKTSILNKIKTH